VSCPVAGFCEAVGGYTEPGGTDTVILAESWNGAKWTIQSVPDPSGSSSAVLYSVSCTSATFCEAAGLAYSSSGTQIPLAETWNGTVWSAQSVPAPSGNTLTLLSSVSCTSATFCLAMGGSPAFTDMWNGTSWSLQATSGGGGRVSCVSPTFCMAVNGTGTTGSEIWNGSSWVPQPIQGPSGSVYTTVGGVSCSSAQACAIVGYYSDNNSTTAGPSFAEAWNGTSWAVEPTPNPAGSVFTSLDAVSCVSAAFCEAGGAFQSNANSSNLEAVAEGWNGDAWALQAAATPPGATPNGLDGVSCVSTAFCEAVGTATDSSSNEISLAEGWNGTSWAIQPTPTPAQSSNGVRAFMSGVSCVSTSFCEAVGYSATGPGAAAWEWNGTSWAAQTVPGSGLNSVSCPSATFCLGVAGDGETDSWNGSAWSQSAAIPSFTANSVSCTSTTSCEAIGSDSTGTQQAAAWNGTAWSLQATPSPADGSDIDLKGVSCLAANDCTAVGWYFQNTTFDQLTLAEHWNGSAWTVQATPTPKGSTVNVLQGVWCSSADFCAAVGDQQNSSTLADLTLVQVWNGTSWTTQSSPNRTTKDLDVLNSVWCDAGDNCTAAGIGADRGEVNATLVETGS
jgi:hypothetical protein